MHAIGIKYYEKSYSITVQIYSNELIVYYNKNDTAGDSTPVFYYTHCNLLHNQHLTIVNAMIKNKSKYTN